MKHRGRPKAGALPERRSTFILLTSDMTFDAKKGIQQYKGQDQNEHGFRWTKSPVHRSAFWLKKTTRVTGLGYLLLLALQFARFMRALVRSELEDQPPLELPHRTVKRPSETVILEALHDLDTQRQYDDSLWWYQWTAVLPYQRRVLEALGVPMDRGMVWDASQCCQVKEFQLNRSLDIANG